MGGLGGGNFLHRKDLLELEPPDKKKVTLTDNGHAPFQSEKQIFDKVIIDSDRPLQMNTACSLKSRRTLL